MVERIDEFPERLDPYIVMGSLDESLPVLRGPFRLVGSASVVLESDLNFVWHPSTRVEFDGFTKHQLMDFEAEWEIVKDGIPRFRVPAFLTRRRPGQSQDRVHGFISDRLDIGEGPIETMRFALANFPAYLGASVRSEQSVFRGRLELESEVGRVTVDFLPEVHELLKSTKSQPGFVVSHVGQWIPSAAEVSIAEAEAVLELLRVWFGFMRGAWAGPLFPGGLRQRFVVWRQFAPWRLSERRPVPSWLPTHHSLDLRQAFAGFSGLWAQTKWRRPLKVAVSWLAEANSSTSGPETKIVLGHVALDLLAWARMVETSGLFSAKDFDEMRANGRARTILEHLKIPTDVPEWLVELRALSHRLETDGPGTISRIRNQLVHPTEKNREKLGELSGRQLFECGQLSLQYSELVLLALCGYSGHYSRRAWTGWEGDDEILVPWA